MLESIDLKNFAIFKNHKLKFSPNINILIGRNSTGKSLLMKLLYSVVETLSKYGEEKSKETIAYELSKKIKGVFLISKVGKLSTRAKGVQKTQVNINFKDLFIKFNFSTKHEKVKVADLHRRNVKGGIYIPTKEIISMMDKGFIGLYENYAFMEEVYYDLAKKLDKPLQRGSPEKIIQELLKELDLTELGRVYREKDEFYTYIKGIGKLESKLVAEGYRKLMIILYLIKNGGFTENEYLFWDEPEVNLNPALSKTIVDLLIFLTQKLNTQIFIATHDYFLIKYFDLKYKQTKKKKFNLKFYSFYFDKEDTNLVVQDAENLYDLDNNSIIDEFEEIYKLDLELMREALRDDH